MPYATQDMIDMIDMIEAVDIIEASSPERPGMQTSRFHYSFGSEFDKFMDLKWSFEPMPDEMVKEFNELFELRIADILKELISAHTQIHGAKNLDFNDSYDDTPFCEDEGCPHNGKPHVCNPPKF